MTCPNSQPRHPAGTAIVMAKANKSPAKGDEGRGCYVPSFGVPPQHITQHFCGNAGKVSRTALDIAMVGFSMASESR
jgi:hypothetical protein